MSFRPLSKAVVLKSVVMWLILILRVEFTRAINLFYGILRAVKFVYIFQCYRLKKNVNAYMNVF